MAHASPARVVLALVAHLSAVLGETLYDAADNAAIATAPDAFTAYQMRSCEVQDGLAVQDTATYLITVDVFDVRARVGGAEADIAVSDKLAAVANAAHDFTAWRGEYAVVRCEATGFTVAAGDDVSDALEAQTSLTAGSVALSLVVLT